MLEQLLTTVVVLAVLMFGWLAVQRAGRHSVPEGNGSKEELEHHDGCHGCLLSAHCLSPAGEGREVRRSTVEEAGSCPSTTMVLHRK